MNGLYKLTCGAFLAALCGTTLLHAQDAPTVRLDGVYNPFLKPNVIVLPMNFPGGDSVRSIMQRDFTNGSRIEVMRGTDSLMLPVRGDPPWDLFARLGAVAVVHVVPVGTSLRVELLEVQTQRSAGVEEFPVQAATNSYEWRWAIHGIADRVEEWITGVRGISQTRIAFTRNGDLCVVDSDGANERVLERGLYSSPAWHPREPTLVFSQFNETGWRIGARAANAGPIRWLTNDGSGANLAPAFSPDGREVYFARQDDRSGNLFVVPFAGGARRRIMQESSENASPTVSPDGSRIIFVTNRLGNPFLYMMDKDGANQVSFGQYSRGTRTYVETPSWSPDGSTIAVQARRGSDSQYQIELLDVRTALPRQITSSGENESPSWAPDSRHIVFTSTRTGVKQLWVMDTKSGAQRQLTHGSDIRNYPAWSPRHVHEP